MSARFIKKTLVSFSVIAVIDIGIFWFNSPHTLDGYGYTLCYSGVIIFILALFSIGNNRISGYNRKHLISPDPVFMRARSFEHPFEQTMLAILAAAIFAFVIGNLLTII